MEGTQIGSYVLERELGQGGFGVVYVGLDTRLGRRAAIKQLRPELSGQRDIVERFFNEAKAAAGINHPGIVEIYDVGWHSDGSAYFAMKLLAGDSLARRLRAAGALPVALAATIARQVSSALAAAHARGIVHRDLKPDNIMLVPDDEVVIGERATVLDFGIAKLFGDQPITHRTRTGMMMGTPGYMSPEQCRGAGEVDHRTDIYALGCILFEMLAGRPPFVAEGAGEVLGMHQFVEPPALRSLRPDVPADLEAVVMRALAKKPEQRQQQMTELTAALQPFAAGGAGSSIVPGASVAAHAHAHAASRAASQAPHAVQHLTPVAPSAMIAPASQSPVSQSSVSQSSVSQSSVSQSSVSQSPASHPPAPSTYSAAQGEVTAPPRRRGRWLSLAIAGSLLAAGGVALALKLSGGSAPAPEPPPSPVASPAIDAAAVAHAAPDAAVPADAAIVAIPALDAPAPIAAIDAAPPARPRPPAPPAPDPGAVAEQQLIAAIASGNAAAVKAAYAKVPSGSPHKTSAKARYDRFVASYTANVQRQAQQLAAKRACGELETLLAQATKLFPSVGEAVAGVDCAPAPPPGGNAQQLYQQANQAAHSGQHAEALRLAEAALAKNPNHRQALVLAAMSACNTRAAAKAKQYFPQLPRLRQSAVRQACARNGVELD